MASMKQKVQMILSTVDVKWLLRDVFNDFTRSRNLTHILAGALVGVGAVWTNQRIELRKMRLGAVDTSKPRKAKAPKIAVNAKLFERLRFIFNIVIPTWKCKEVGIILVQCYILVARSLLSIRMAKMGGTGLKAVVERSWPQFFQVLTNFAVTGVIASVVNSGLKFTKNLLSLYTRQRLTHHVHGKYLSDRNYYKAVLNQDSKSLDNADQRIAQDLNDFADTASDLFQRTFKPLLDVVLSTATMAKVLGIQGPLTLYSYFVASAIGLSMVVPPFGRMIAEEKVREGNFRRSHARLIAHAEEIAFLGGAEREKAILNEELDGIVSHQRKVQLMRFKQGVIDQWVIKYAASCIGYPVLALPFLLTGTNLSASEIALQYRYADGLIRNSSSAIGDLMLVYKKVQKLAGFAARVSELLEAVDENKDIEDKQAGSIIIGDVVSFDHVDVSTPDGRLLIKDLVCTLPYGSNVMVTGPNGAGKSSLFRVLAGLWPVASGVLTRPEGTESEVFYVPQNPYLVSGSLLEQIAYPLSHSQALAKLDAWRKEGRKGFDASRTLEEEIIDCLKRVGLKKFTVADKCLERTHHDWADVLSGGEKQRIGIARLFFHKPRFAIMDESTSAVNVDEEGPMYQHVCDLGITVFSIAHRLALRRFHHKELHLEGDGSGSYTLTDIVRE